jgi:hypothetical protein
MVDNRSQFDNPGVDVARLDQIQSMLDDEKVRRRAVAGPAFISQLLKPTLGIPGCPPGSLLIIWSASRKKVERIRATFESDTSILISAQFDTNALDKAFDQTQPFPRGLAAFSSIRYRERNLVEYAIDIPGVESLDRVTVAWLGVPLIDSDFSSISWVRPGVAPHHYLVIANPPELDPDDARLLASIPNAVSELGVGVAPTSWAQVAAKVGEAVVDWATAKVTDAVANGVEKKVRADVKEVHQRQREQEKRANARNGKTTVVATSLSGSVPIEYSVADLLEVRTTALQRHKNRSGGA